MKRTKRTENLGTANRNPLNIRFSAANHWLGLHPLQPNVKGFCRFTNFDYGYRAAILLIKNYIRRYRCDTPAQIIHRWAPPSENRTDLYIACVCGRSGLAPEERILLEGNQIPRLVAAMAKQETGLHPTPEYLQDLCERFHI